MKRVPSGEGLLLVEVVLDGPGDVVDHGEVLLAAGFDGGQQGFDKPASLFALGAETQLSPDDRMTQAAFRRVIGRLDALHLKKCPQPFTVIEKLTTHPIHGSAMTAQQQRIHFLADRRHRLLKLLPRQCSVPAAGPRLKQFVGRPHEIVSKAFNLVIGMVDQRLKVSLQVSPAPLQPPALPVHLCPVAAHHAGELLPQQLCDGCGRTTAADGEHGEGLCHKCPQPGFRVRLLRGRFVAVQRRLR